ncbi:MAG: 2-oxo acid dehydrogenase subunit E2 [Planctomycetes bacterium]|nr:2-oxo acid dehydrogenase subunit E2 [Planctomycetota bacterium]
MNEIPILMPHMGQSIAEGTVVKWHKHVGDEVRVDELLVEVESDKVAFEVVSPATGRLTACLKDEGDVTEVGTAIGTLESEEELGLSQTTIAANYGPKEISPEADAQVAESDDMDQKKILPGELPALTGEWLSPSVARLALRHHISLAELEQLKGSGRSGRVTRRDLLEYLSTRTTPSTSGTAVRADVSIEELKKHGRVVSMTAIRRSIADHMVQSIHTSAHVTMVHALDLTNLVALRESVKKSFKVEHSVNLTYTGIMIYIIGRLMHDFPMINASTFGSYILQRDAVNIGCAVALPDESLVVPVVRHADARSMPDIATELDRLVRSARSRDLVREDVEDGTFTISNFGTFGSLFGTPIINQPQVAILGMGAITKQPVPDEAKGVAFRDVLYLSFSFDHRVIDGAAAGRFFKELQDGADALTAEILCGG